MGQQHTTGKHCTTVVNNDKLARVTYHGTDVVLWDKVAGTITLNTGGYFTVTTKARMNQALSQWGIRANVYQKKGEWYCNPHYIDGTHRRFNGESLTIKLQGGAL